MCEGAVRSGWDSGVLRWIERRADVAAGDGGVMTLAWMAGIGCLIAPQKLLPSRVAIDVSVALALVGLGIVIIMPSAIPGLVPTMTPMRPA